MDKDFKVGALVTAVIFFLLPSARVFDGGMFIWAFIVNCIVSATFGFFTAHLYNAFSRPKIRR